MTQPLDTRVFEAFSSPFEGDFVFLGERLVSMLPGLIMSRLAKEDLPPVVTEALAALATGEFAEDIFRPELGTAGYGATTLWRDDPSPEWITGQFLIAAFFAGAIRAVDHRFRARHPIVVAGRVHRADAFAIRGQGDTLELSNGEGRLLARLQRSEGPGPAIWLEENDPAPIALGSLSRAKRTYGEWAGTWGEPDPEPRPSRDSQFGQQVSAAFGLMETYTPEYYLWTASVLREAIAKGRSDAETTTSCSYLHNLGAIEVCEPATEFETAEMFVHECSHQQYQLLCWSSRMTERDAPDVYSVLKRTSRPLDRVLLGYHAFGNCLNMYSLFKERGAPADADYLEGRIRFVRRLVDALYQPIIENKRWITPMGLAIFQPLTDRLVAKGLIDDEEAAAHAPRIANVFAD